MTEPYRMRSVETWARARQDYAAGLTAEAVCRRYDLGLSAFRKRALRYGWRRCDQADPAPDCVDLDLYDDVRDHELIQQAWLRFGQAVMAGRAVEARRWRRLWTELRDQRDRMDRDFHAGLSKAERAEMRAALDADYEAEEAALDADAPRLTAPLPPPPSPDAASPQAVPAEGAPDAETETLAPTPGAAPNVHYVHPVFSRVDISGPRAEAAPPADPPPRLARTA